MATKEEIDAALFNDSVRNQVSVEKYKADQVKKIEPFLQAIAAYVVQRLQFAELTDYRRDRLQKLLRAINSHVADQLNEFTVENRKEWRKFGAYQARLEVANIANALDNPAFEAVIPTSAQVAAAAAATPLSIRGPGAGLDLSAYTRTWSQAQQKAVTGNIAQGVAEGQTNAEIIKRIRGTELRKFRDGVLGLTYRQTEAYVRTVIQHISSTARAESMAASGAKQYQWRATLDARTCETCASLSNEIFDLGEGPLPPAHPNCRCQIVEVFGPEWAWLTEGAEQSSTFGPVDADMSYYTWVKTQNAAWQDFAIGPTYGKLLRNGGLTADQFAKLRVDKYTGKPLSLAKMEVINPAAFKKANIKLNPTTGMPIDG
jgi:SPP1 gp7 family putative phage head morphogenesis protein